jgi:hypothetical protein
MTKLPFIDYPSVAPKSKSIIPVTCVPDLMSEFNYPDQF